MNKILLIAKREFLTRVKKKTFLLTTIGLPLLIFGLYALIIYFTVKDRSDYKIAVTDNANIFKGALVDSLKNKKGTIYIDQKNASKASLDKQLKNEEIDAYIFIPQEYKINYSNDSIQVVSRKNIGIITQSEIKEKLRDIVDNGKMLTALNITQKQLDSIQKPTKIDFNTLKIEEGKETEKIEKGGALKSGVSYGVGMFFGVLIYMVLLIYGTMVMRGVMEEKTNRIAEVIVSSVKPFQLMMGKIIGIGSVGLLQFIIWITLMSSLKIAGSLIFGDSVSSVTSQMQPGMEQASAAMQQSGAMDKLNEILSTLNIPLLIGCFLFYFLGGYFMYASLFAAVGSCVDEDPQQAQSLTLPVTMPIIFGFVIMMQTVNNPNSGLAVFGSMFPLTSPIVMMARVAHGVPDGVSTFQLILSMLLLIAGFLGTTWLAGKIYRTGILMYGKKVTLKEIAKWAFRKN